MPTVQEVLQGRTQIEDFYLENPGGGNTTIRSKIFIESCQPWNDFTLENIKASYEEQLNESYEGEREPKALDEDKFIYNEETVHDMLARYIYPIINYALYACGLHFGRGSRCKIPGYVPDLSVIWRSKKSKKPEPGATLTNLLPGDTKIGSKWESNMLRESSGPIWEESTKVIRQVVTYMATCSSRYGFLITDTEVVALRIRRVTTGASQRQLRIRHSTDVARPERPRNSDVSNASGSVFEDHPLNWDYTVEYKAVPWTTHGKGRLTGKLVLWALAQMAAFGESSIDETYPPLDSWRERIDGRGYTHVTSGVTVGRRRAGMTICGPAPPAHDAPGGGTDGGWAAAGAGATMPPEDDLYEDDREPQHAPRTNIVVELPARPAPPRTTDAVEEEEEVEHRAGGTGAEPERVRRSTRLAAAAADAKNVERSGGLEVAPARAERQAEAEQRKKAAAPSSGSGASGKDHVIRVTLKKSGREFTFRDQKGEKRCTAKKDRKKEADGYSYRGKKYTYFTENLP